MTKDYSLSTLLMIAFFTVFGFDRFLSFPYYGVTTGILAIAIAVCLVMKK